MNFSKKTFLLFSSASLVFLSGCASIGEVVEGVDYPQDTAILIDGVPYQINMIKCAEIRSIKNSDLDCYDQTGNQSASIAPVSAWRREIVEKNYGGWASQKHQDFLFNYFHRGGMERNAAAIMQGYGIFTQIKSINDMIDKSKEMDATEAQKRLEGSTKYYSGGMSAWQAHQSNMAEWRLKNMDYFKNQIQK